MDHCKGICVTGSQCKNSGKYDGFCNVHVQIECGICLDFIEKRTSYYLDCGHKFCEKCINTWIIEKKEEATCPMCRNYIDKTFLRYAETWGVQNNLLLPIKVNCYNLNVLDDYEQLLVTVFIGMDFNTILIKKQIDFYSIPSEIWKKLHDYRIEKIMFIEKPNYIIDFNEVYIVLN